MPYVAISAMSSGYNIIKKRRIIVTSLKLDKL